MPSPLGRFSCKSFRRLILRIGQVLIRWKGSWKIPVPLKFKYFVWLVLKDRVTDRDKLKKLGIMQPEWNVRPLCNEGIEDSRHIFVLC